MVVMSAVWARLTYRLVCLTVSLEVMTWCPSWVNILTGVLHWTQTGSSNCSIDFIKLDMHYTCKIIQEYHLLYIPHQEIWFVFDTQFRGLYSPYPDFHVCKYKYYISIIGDLINCPEPKVWPPTVQNGCGNVSETCACESFLSNLLPAATKARTLSFPPCLHIQTSARNKFKKKCVLKVELVPVVVVVK